jgi:hypothetical protein
MTRKSVLDDIDMPAEIERVRREDGKLPSHTLPTHKLSKGIFSRVDIVMLPAHEAPRDQTGMIRLLPPVPRGIPNFIWGKICTACPLKACQCHRYVPTHWGDIPSDLL